MFKDLLYLRRRLRWGQPPAILSTCQLSHPNIPPIGNTTLCHGDCASPRVCVTLCYRRLLPSIAVKLTLDRGIVCTSFWRLIEPFSRTVILNLSMPLIMLITSSKCHFAFLAISFFCIPRPWGRFFRRVSVWVCVYGLHIQQRSSSNEPQGKTGYAFRSTHGSHRRAVACHIADDH